MLRRISNAREKYNATWRRWLKLLLESHVTSERLDLQKRENRKKREIFWHTYRSSDGICGVLSDISELSHPLKSEGQNIRLYR
jgi:hypothetical protein